MLQQTMFQTMGTEFELVCDCDGKLFFELVTITRKWLSEFEQRFSRFRLDSELSGLNSRAGRKVGVTPPMWQMLILAQQARTISHGYFNPFILPNLIQAGYHRSFELLKDEEPPAVDHFQDLIGLQIELYPTTQQIKMPSDSMIDLGGIAKGVAVDQLAQLLKQSVQSFWVSIGGDMLLVGEPFGLDKWNIQVQNPRRLEANWGVLHLPGLEDMAVATSGTMGRRGNRGGLPWHHLIDPQTGKPSTSELISATVLAREVWLSDILAKTLVIAGWNEGSKILDEAQAIAWLDVTAHGDCRESSRMGDYLVYET
jgi:thiamine biosynthesis lipoprotein